MTAHSLQRFRAGPWAFINSCLLQGPPNFPPGPALGPLQRILLQTKSHCIAPLLKSSTAPRMGYRQHPEILRPPLIWASTPTLLVTSLESVSLLCPLSPWHTLTGVLAIPQTYQTHVHFQAFELAVHFAQNALLLGIIMASILTVFIIDSKVTFWSLC